MIMSLGSRRQSVAERSRSQRDEPFIWERHKVTLYLSLKEIVVATRGSKYFNSFCPVARHTQILYSG